MSDIRDPSGNPSWLEVDTSHNLKTGATINLGGFTIADGDDAATGTTTDTRAAWYTASASVIALLKLLIGATVRAGSHAYTYDGSHNMLTDAWTLFGTTRTKTYTYTGADRMTESDWV